MLCSDGESFGAILSRPAGFLVAILLCLVTHGILKADMFEAGGRFWGVGLFRPEDHAPQLFYP